MIKSHRELQLEYVLRQLVDNHFFGKELEWGWIEGTTICSIDNDLWLKICQLLPEVINKK